VFRIINSLIITILVTSCGAKRAVIKTPFEELYTRLEQKQDYSVSTAKEWPKIDISVSGIELSVVLRSIADQSKVSVMAQEGLEKLQCYLDVQQQPVDQVLQALARRLGVQLSQQGEIFFLGNLRAEDRGVLVRRATRLSPDDLKRAVSVVLSKDGKVETYPDGVVVVGDVQTVLEKVAQLIDSVEQVPVTTWIMQLYIVSISQQKLMDIGMDTQLTGQLSASIMVDKFNPIHDVMTKQASAALTSVLSLTRDTQDGSLVASPTFLLIDGEHGKFRSGQQVVIPRKAVTDQGTVTTTGYDIIPVGTSIDVGLRELGNNTARLTFDISIDRIQSLTETYPQIAGDKFTTTANLADSGTYLIGSIERSSKSTGKRGPLITTLMHKESSSQQLQVWAQIYRIGGPIPERILVEGGPAHSGGFLRPETR
jgi:type II secretory pathway component GspD/PulD (secretin)